MVWGEKLLKKGSCSPQSTAVLLLPRVRTHMYVCMYVAPNVYLIIFKLSGGFFGCVGWLADLVAGWLAGCLFIGVFVCLCALSIILLILMSRKFAWYLISIYVLYATTIFRSQMALTLITVIRYFTSSPHLPFSLPLPLYSHSSLFACLLDCLNFKDN